MDFFHAQDTARGRTLRLVVLLVLAVASLVALTNLLVMVFVSYFDIYPYPDENGIPVPAGPFHGGLDLERFLFIGAAVLLVVVASSLYKMSTLSRGGKAVVESLGGRLVSPDASEPHQRRLLNVVEEMAIAAGAPVPAVYLLEGEDGINAFAAGLSPADAAIGITSGALEQLDRDQLQGVIGHEMSHIVNGDMRLNLRLVALLHGVLVIGLIGYFLVRAGFASSSNRRHTGSRGNDSLPLMFLGAGLMAIGYGGTFFANIIKASVNRQREYLADASSVQFTRNPRGIAGALKRIGGYPAGSRLGNPHAPELSHAYFSQGVGAFFGRLTASHPPIEERIRRLEPGWNGRFDGSPPPGAADTETGALGLAAAGPSPAPASRGVPAASAATATAEAIAHVGHPDDAHLRYAQTLIGRLPATLHWAAREPFGARALVYGMLLDRDSEILRRQLDHLDSDAVALIREETERLLPSLRGLPRAYRLPLLDLAMPALRQLSAPQYRRFEANLKALVRMDGRIGLFEWTLERLVLERLERDIGRKSAPRIRYAACAKLAPECTLIFSLLARAQGKDPAQVGAAFAAAAAAAGLEGVSPLPPKALRHTALDAALDKLAELHPEAKQRLLTACAAAILADQQVVPQELEVLRAVSAVIDYPMPPILVPGDVRATTH